jgi:hypothetical protein
MGVMAKRKYEKTQKGNPHALPVRQHVFPYASIARFTDNKGGVSLHHLATGQERKARPSDNIFCAMRAWDTRAEVGYMKQIESGFQALASLIIEDKVTKIEGPDKHKVDLFFALWKMRAIFRAKDGRAKEMTDIQFKFNGLLTGGTFTKDQEEIFEKNGISFLRAEGVAPAHHVHGIQIQAGIMREMSALSVIKWAIVHVHLGQFIVPDFISTTFIPLEPTLCLCGTAGNMNDNGTIFRTNAVDINLHLKAHCKEYYFANDLRECF